jgi:uncharacterized protein DUF1559
MTAPRKRLLVLLFLIVGAIGCLMTGLFLSDIRHAANNQKTSNNMKQIALAVLNYEKTYRRLPPPAITDENGKPLLSWRVAILPCFERDESRYSKFKLDEPWDSPRNTLLLNRMPQVYRSASRTKEWLRGETHFRIFVGKNTPFSEGASIEQIRAGKGLENMIMLAETDEAVPWTKPDELEYSRNNPLPKMGGLNPWGVNLCLFDGQTVRLSLPQDETQIRRMIQSRDE